MRIIGRVVDRRGGYKHLASRACRAPDKADDERTGAVAPRGQKGTKQPRIGDDRSIGSKLTDKQVGPVDVRYATPELEAIAKSAADDVTAAGQMNKRLMTSSRQVVMRQIRISTTMTNARRPRVSSTACVRLTRAANCGLRNDSTP